MDLTLIFEVFVCVNTWSGLCWVPGPFAYFLWILGKCGGFGMPDRECSVCGLMTEMSGD